MFEKSLTFLKPGFLPFVFAALFTLLLFASELLPIPSPAELVEIGGSLFEEYGLYAFFLIVLIEGFFTVGLYFPGSFLIILAVLLSPKTFVSLASLALVAWVGFAIMSAINYLFGAYGLHRVFKLLGAQQMINNMRSWLEKRGVLIVFLMSIDPSYLSVAQTTMGITRYGLVKTVVASMISLAIWIPVWTIIAATLVTQIDITNPSQGLYFLGVLLLWGVIMIAIEQYKLHKTTLTRI